MASPKAVPFGKEDLERPSSEGRSLHDTASFFLRTVMSLETPIRNLPKSSEVQKAFGNLDPEKDGVAYQMMIDLQATPLEALWPGMRSPPATKEGVLWNAVNKLKTPGAGVIQWPADETLPSSHWFRHQLPRLTDQSGHAWKALWPLCQGLAS